MFAETWTALSDKLSHVKLSSQLGILAATLGVNTAIPLLVQPHGWSGYTLQVGGLLLTIATGSLLVSSVKRSIGAEPMQARDAAKALARGDFSSNQRSAASGDHVMQAINQSKQTVIDFKEQLAATASEFAKGNFQAALDVNAFSGEYRQLAQQMNDVLSQQTQALHQTGLSLQAIGQGDLNAQLRTFTGDLTILNQGFDALKGNVKALMQQLLTMSSDHAHGETETRLNTQSLPGDFQKIAEEINTMVNGYVLETERFIAVMDSIGRGDLTANLEAMPGKKAAMNKSVDRIRGNLKGIVDSVNWVNAEHEKGNIDMTLRADMFRGQFSLLADSINNIVAGHIELNQKAMACVQAFGDGNFDAPLEQFPGQKAQINQTIEQVRANLKALNADAQMLAEAAREGRVTIRANADKHPGDCSGDESDAGHDCRARADCEGSRGVHQYCGQGNCPGQCRPEPPHRRSGSQP